MNWSTSSTILQGHLHRTTYLPISKPFTIPSAPILPLAGVHLQVLKPNLPLPPPDCSTLYLCVFIRLFHPVLCPFLGEGLKPTIETACRLLWSLCKVKNRAGPYSNKTSHPVFPRRLVLCTQCKREKRREEKNQRFVWTCRIFASRSRVCSRGG